MHESRQNRNTAQIEDWWNKETPIAENNPFYDLHSPIFSSMYIS